MFARRPPQMMFRPEWHCGAHPPAAASLPIPGPGGAFRWWRMQDGAKHCRCTSGRSAHRSFFSRTTSETRPASEWVRDCLVSSSCECHRRRVQCAKDNGNAGGRTALVTVHRSN